MSTRLGAVTDAQGKYRITGVAAGTVTIRARRIGFLASERTVSLADDQSLTVNFALSVAPLLIDAMVVTGHRAAQVRAPSAIRSSGSM
ncbi:MAG: carboxypeptidase regulatory-like domain-containing protein [Gemmatimonadetes bacterium]|nr:carboxypeptidase regulatory-like domain-containing protein [Gemmatimonadota bacterium]